MLEETLQSHNYALSLNPENADVLYNTAQVLVSLEQKLGDDDKGGFSKPQRRQFLEEAVQLFGRCLSIQEHEHASSLEEDGGVLLDDSTDEEEERATEEASARDEEEMDVDPSETRSQGEGEQWATIIEPVTAFALLETATAYAEALADLVLVSGPYGPGEFDAQLQRFDSLIQYKVIRFSRAVEQSPEPPATASPDRGLSISLLNPEAPAQAATQTPKQTALAECTNSVASAHSVLAEAKYRSNLSSASDFATDVVACFAPEFFVARNIPFHPAEPSLSLAYAAELIDAAATIREVSEQSSLAVDQSTASSRWKLLSGAQNLLAGVASTAPNKARLYTTRGDVELLRFWLSRNLQPDAAKTLLRNAGVYFRGAAAHARQLRAVAGGGDGDEILLEAEVKERAAAVLADLGAAESEGPRGSGKVGFSGTAYTEKFPKVKIEAVVKEMLEDFFIEAEWRDAVCPFLTE